MNKEMNEDKDLSLDELGAVSGGKADRNWLEDGCAATVEAGSDCWGTDRCKVLPVTYDHFPIEDPCPQCGGQMYFYETESVRRFEHYNHYRCLRCNYDLREKA